MTSKYINPGAEEFLNSLKPGTYPKNKDEDEFLEYLIKDANQYLTNNYKLVYEQYNNKLDPSEDYLKSMPINPKFMVILSIDIIGSTKISKILNLYDNAKLITLFSRAIGAIIHNYNGYVLKYVGDGIISYFPEPDEKGMHDNALYCSYVIKKYIIKYLNPLLIKNKFPELKFRMGINSGEVIKTIVGYNQIKQHYDLIGDTINIASKIQEVSLENSILLGQSTSPLLHDFWKTKLTQVELPEAWKLVKIKEVSDYKIYRLDALF